jgi:N6-adenosine-specific RNA methylase IME4
MKPDEAVLQRMDAARQALAEAKTFSQMKRVHSAIEAMREWLRQQKECSIAIANDAALLRLEAEARMGEMLSREDVVKTTDGRPAKPSSSKTVSAPTHSEIGVSRDQARKYRAVASVPAEVVRHLAEEATERGEELTRARLLKLVTKTTQPIPSDPPPIPAGKFNLIYADPPWQDDFRRGGTRDVANHYATMTLEQIAGLRAMIDKIRTKDCVLFLWARSPMLPEALQILSAWGFEYKTSAIWVKSGTGMGYYFRQDHEILLIGTRGRPGVPEPRDRQSSVIQADKSRHSEKPQVFYEIIERMYPASTRVELFARDVRAGWTAWGAEINYSPSPSGG